MIWRHIVTARRWRPVARLVAAALLALPAIGAGGVPASAVTPGAGISTYYHVTSSSDTGWFLTNLHNTGGSGALVFVTPNWGQIPIQTNYHPVGVLFNGGTGWWSIYNEDGAAMPTNVAFNVLEFQPPLPSVFVHTATTSNSTGNWTDMDNPALNNNPNAVVVVTPSFNPGGISGTSDPSPVGVWYNTSTLRWSIFNEDGSAVPNGASFNVDIAGWPYPACADGPCDNWQVHTATSDNTTGNLTCIDLSSPSGRFMTPNGNPNALAFVTHNLNPGGSSPFAPYDNAPLALVYENSSQWCIVNQGGQPIQIGTTFNVIMPDLSFFGLGGQS